MSKKLFFGKLVIEKDDYLDILVSGRKYVLHVTEITDYNQIVGETPDGDPVMIRVSKVTAIRKISSEIFQAMKNVE
jgi:SepF-like predicted cell division protein (DUF552 family)